MHTPSAAEFVDVREPVGPKRDFLPLIIIALAIGALWFVVCRYLSAEWSFNEQYNYGWFVPLFAAYLFWLRWQDRPEKKLQITNYNGARGTRDIEGKATRVGASERGQRASFNGPIAAEIGSQRSDVRSQTLNCASAARTGFRISAAAVVLIAGAALVLLPVRVFEIGSADWRPLGWIHVAAAATITLSIIYLIGGKAWLRHFSFPVLFFFVSVPWIGPVEEPIVQGLMRIIAASAAETLALLGIPAEVQGNLIRLPNGLVGVNEACSGVRSLQTSLMIGLLFGELKRLRWIPRLLLVVCAIAIAMIANFLRATFLVWIASAQTISAVKRWHDFAGYTIVVLVFAGTMFLASRFRSEIGGRRSDVSGRRSEPANPKSEIRNPQLPITDHRSLITLGILLLFWLGLVELGAESWYRLHERHSIARAGWSVRWPEQAHGYQEIKIDSEVRNILRFDYGREATWTSTGASALPRAVHYLFFMRWNPGSGTILRARAHRPDICLPAAGWIQTGPDRIQNFEIVAGRSLPFRRFEFVKQGNQGLHATAYFTLHEDVAHETEIGADSAAGLYSNWDWPDRWRVVRNGIRNRGQQVLESITITPGRTDQAAVDNDFAELLPKVVEGK